VRTATRYRLHDLLRTDALQQAARRNPADVPAAITRLLDDYISTADAAGRLLAPLLARMPDLPTGGASFDDENHALQWMEAERPNLVAAVSEAPAARSPDERAGWSMPCALPGRPAVPRRLVVRGHNRAGNGDRRSRRSR